ENASYPSSKRPSESREKSRVPPAGAYCIAFGRSSAIRNYRKFWNALADDQNRPWESYGRLHDNIRRQDSGAWAFTLLRSRRLRWSTTKEWDQMKRSKFSEEQVAYAPRRITDETREWEVIAPPYSTAGGRIVHARVQRIDQPDSLGDTKLGRFPSAAAWSRRPPRRAHNLDGPDPIQLVGQGNAGPVGPRAVDRQGR